MRWILIALGLTLSALPAWSQVSDADWSKCQNSDPDTIISVCTAIIQSGQATGANLANAYYNRGDGYGEKGLLDLAITDFDTAISLKPDDAEAFLGRGICYEAKGVFAQAVADYDKAIVLKPDFAIAYYNRGHYDEGRGLRTQAIADYEATLRFAAANQQDPNTAYAVAAAKAHLKHLGVTP
ncbi:MAG TPA: tetratricopeptide repeat protein [Rhizomicrobium sp.]|nr:tetratricopeptide repeat protein [Rhizomicrobium sp.]